jgi:hypothetical protein
VAVIQARPGPALWAGLDAARSGWQATKPDRPVIALAPSASEAWELEAATGVETRLIDDGMPSGPPSIVLIPGAQRLGTRAIAPMLDRARARGDTVVFIDGSRRPAALDGRDLLSRLAAARAGPDHLPELAPDEKPTGPLDRLDRPGGSVTLCPNASSRSQAAVEDWARHGPERGRLEARRWADAEDLNRRARQLIAPPGPAVRAGGRDYCAGEPVIVRRSSPPLGLTRGRTGTVVGVDPQHRQLSILFAGDKGPVQLDARRVAPSVLAHGYALVTSRRRVPPGPVFTLDGGRRSTSGHAQVHHYVIAGRDALSNQRTHRDPLTRLAHAVGPAPPAAGRSPRPGLCHSLDDLTAERLLLATRLRAGLAHLPGRRGDPDLAAAALDDAREERDAARHWAVSGVPGAAARLAAAEAAVQHREHAAMRLNEWIRAHHPELAELARLDQTIASRTELIGRAAELLPGRELVAALGPPPERPLDRRAWRAAAVALETGRDAAPRLGLARLGRPGPGAREPAEPQRAVTICLP